jgi:hypothetical protein
MSGSVRRLATAGLVVAIVLALMTGTGGVLYAAEEAAPGEPLYGIDQAMESARLSLTSEPQARMELLLSLAEERLEEAEKLSGKGDTGNLELALSSYGATISALARSLSEMGDLEAQAVSARVDQSFSAHEAQLAGILQEAGSEEELGKEAGTCVGADPHPVAASLAASYGIPDEQVLSWFCDRDYGLGEIMHALGTGEQTGVPAENLLTLKTELGGWGRVWQGLGLIGREKNRPVGPSEDRAEGQPEDRPVGPPEDKPGGQPEDRPVGPPEDKPGDQPEDRPVGPPEDQPGGKPEDKPGRPAKGEEPPGSESDLCTGADPHPNATKLAKDYDMAYEQIMAWFCEGGHGLGDIMLALRTGQDTDVPAGDLLALKNELGGWGQVWQELGLIGKPAEAPGNSAKEKPRGQDKEKPAGKP